MREFDKEVERHQVGWRAKHISCREYGVQNGCAREWILPEELWEEGLWEGIRSGAANSLAAYLGDEIDRHKGSHNLKSSWVLCANLYFPFRREAGRALLATFLKEHVCGDVDSVEAVELEYAEPGELSPQKLLGEPGGGRRGSNQTSPDVAFVVGTVKGGKGLVLTENKYTEHSFYSCSGRKAEYGNPDPKRCLDFGLIYGDRASNCYQCSWQNGDGRRENRRYWDYIEISDDGRRVLTRCPATTAGYQLFRQQALAEGIARNSDYEFVFSCVAYEERNETLIECLRETGVADFSKEWGTLFAGRARFATFTHEQWVGWVREHDAEGRWRDWLKYIGERYGY